MDDAAAGQRGTRAIVSAELERFLLVGPEVTSPPRAENRLERHQRSVNRRQGTLARLPASCHSPEKLIPASDDGSGPADW